MANRIKMPFGVVDLVGSMNDVLDGIQIPPPRKRANCGGMGGAMCHGIGRAKIG